MTLNSLNSLISHKEERATTLHEAVVMILDASPGTQIVTGLDLGVDPALTWWRRWNRGLPAMALEDIPTYKGRAPMLKGARS